MTEKYTVSNYFQGSDREIILEAVKNSILPEGVAIVGKEEYKTAKKPFVVIAHAAYPDEAAQIIKGGAFDYVQMISDAKRLAQSLSI